MVIQMGNMEYESKLVVEAKTMDEHKLSMMMQEVDHQVTRPARSRSLRLIV